MNRIWPQGIYDLYKTIRLRPEHQQYNVHNSKKFYWIGKTM